MPYLATDEETDRAVPVDYVERVNRAIDHIVRNLAQPLSLEEVGSDRGFEPLIC